MWVLSRLGQTTPWDSGQLVTTVRRMAYKPGGMGGIFLQRMHQHRMDATVHVLLT
jgi:hypothetical protein